MGVIIMYKPSQRPDNHGDVSPNEQYELLTNSYSLDISTTMYQYAVTITPELDLKKERRTREGISF